MGPVGISLRPDRLKRYRDLARLFFKYGRADLVTRAGLDEALAGDTPVEENDPGGPDPNGLSRELEQLGPAFVSWDSSSRRVAISCRRRISIFFVAAAGGGVWLAFNILTSDKDPKRR
jgi:hypothetical protein